MTAGGRTFSDSWHRVADLRLGLRPTVSIRKLVFRGEVWFLVHDPFNNSYFRVRPEAYQFVARLHPSRTVEQVWEECLEKYPDTAPGQEEAIQLLGQLHHNNLLYYRGSTDSTRTFERYEKRLQRALQQRLMNLLFPRFNLFDPDRFLARIMPLIKVATSWLGWMIWFAIVGYGLKQVFDHFGLLKDQIEGVLAPSNWPLLYAAIIFVKTVHEMGHAMLCKRYGGEVHTIGVSFLLFTPLPFVDASSAWSLRSRWHRALVGAGGMIAELAVAGVAAVVWASTGPGSTHALAYNVMWICSVSTLVFNANPLVRLDGYYILSDLVEIPNLFDRANQQLVYLVEYYAFGYKDGESPAHSNVEAVMLAVFGLLSGWYRLIVTAGIVLFVADKFLLVGLVMAVLTGIAFFVVPLWRLVVYLATNPRLMRKRVRAVLVCTVVLGSAFALVGLVPMPVRFRALGVVEPVTQAEIACDASGYLLKLFEPSGAVVTAGQPLVQLQNKMLDLSIKEATADVAEVDATIAKFESASQADLEPARKRRDIVVAHLEQLRKQRDHMLVRSRQDGVWIAPKLAEHIGNWMDRGTVLGKVIDPHQYRLTAVVLQEEAHQLFLDQARKVEARLRGQAEIDIPVTSFKIVPYQRRKLPSAVLGWRGGGDIAVTQTDATGLETVEPFFEIYAFLAPPRSVAVLTGRSGMLRFTLDEQPLLVQWIRRLRQLVQRRYRT